MSRWYARYSVGGVHLIQEDAGNGEDHVVATLSPVEALELGYRLIGRAIDAGIVNLDVDTLEGK